MVDRRPRLTIRVSCSPNYGSGVEFEFSEPEVNEILKANGYSEIDYENVGPCGLTDYHRDEWRVQGPNNKRTDARWAMNEIMKKRIKALLLGV